MKRINCLSVMVLLPIGWLITGNSSPVVAATLYVANTDDNSVLTVDSAGIKHLFASNAQAGYITFDGAGNLYASQYNIGGLLKITSTGTQIPMASGLDVPGGVAVDSHGNVFVADINATVVEVSSSGQVSNFATGGPLIRPSDLAFDSSGTLDYCDWRASSVGKIAANGTVTVIATGLGNTQALALDGNDNIYVSDIDNHRINKVTQSGTVSIFETGLQNVQGLAYDRQSGLLFASDRATNSIYEISQAGQVSLFASSFGTPAGIAFSTVVPEPASIVLAAAGIVTLLCRLKLPIAKRT